MWCNIYTQAKYITNLQPNYIDKWTYILQHSCRCIISVSLYKIAWKKNYLSLYLLYMIISVLYCNSSTNYTSIEKYVANLTSDIASKVSGTTIGLTILIKYLVVYIILYTQTVAVFWYIPTNWAMTHFTGK